MFTKAGMALEKGMQKNSLRTGQCKNYYENGKLRMEGNYVEGKKTGVQKIYHPNQKIKATGKYINGEKADNWVYYAKNGKRITPDPKLIEEDEDWSTYSGTENQKKSW